jgi:Protein of unknown function (DUF3108)
VRGPRLLRDALIALAAASSAAAQDPAPRDSASARAAPRQDSAAAPRGDSTAGVHRDATVALLPGEKLEYDVSLGGIGVGRGSMELVGYDTVRGHRVLHSVFRVNGGILWYKVDDVLESRFDPTTMISYRFVQRINEVNYHRLRVYDFYPESAMYVQEGKPQQPSVKEPLDDGAFFYFVRTVPLVIGETYSFERYFLPDRNPVIVKVLRRDTITVKAGRFPAIVIRPIIKSGGLFAEGGEATMWLSDDDRHMLVQMKVKTKVPILKSLNLYLRKYTAGGQAARDSGAATPR